MVRLNKVKLRKRSVHPYRSFCLARDLRALSSFSEELAGRRVIHVNATPVGGGVAEMLQTLVPLQRGIGLRSDWYVIEAPKRFFVITKEIHNGMQGKAFALEDDDLKYYVSVNEKLATCLSEIPYDVAVIHDPQPMALIGSYHQSRRKQGRPSMISRIHIDLSSPDQKLLRFLWPYLTAYEKVVFTLPAFVPRGFRKDQVAIIPPAIDPLNEKNRALPSTEANKIIEDLGMDPTRPLISQVSRFDPWKNPVGVVEAYRIAKKSIPDLQLAMVGIQRAKDDPEAVKIFREVKAAAGDDPDIHLFHSYDQLKPYTNEQVVNAIQVAADVILQLSIREGFGLTVTEAMWKAAAVIGGPAAGIRSQISDGRNGYIAKDSRAAAKRIVDLLFDPKKRSRIGAAAHEAVRSKHLITSQLLDHLKLYKDVLGG